MNSPFPFPSVIDSSMLASYKSCSQKWNLSSLQEWKPKESSVHLTAGKAFARGIEIARRSFFEEQSSQDTSIEKGMAALIQEYGDFQCPADSAKSLERMMGALEFYFESYPLGGDGTEPILLPSGKRAIEFTFAHPVPIAHPQTGDPILICGALDALLSYAGGVYMCDEKTTSQLGASWSRQWDLRGQFTCYAWGCRESGVPVDGAMVRGISILKTKYETQQAITYRPQWQIDRWYDETLEWIERMIFEWKRGKFLHNLDHACAEYGGCGFRQVCTSQEPLNWLETYFERRHWDPIKRVETVLDTMQAGVPGGDQVV